MNVTVDHLLWGTPDLERGMQRWAALTGNAAQPGGSHPGNGTRNALVPLQGGCYLEILAPDSSQSLAGTAGEQLAALSDERLWGFCCRGVDLEVLARQARALGLSVRGPLPSMRTRPDGSSLRWSLLYLIGHDFGGLAPFFIDWGDSPHPSQGGPATFALTALTASYPDPALENLYRALDLPVAVHAGPPALHAVLKGPRGSLTLAT